MKTIFLALLIAIVCLGCASRYDITMGNGTKITTQGKPKLSNDKTEWYYTDMSGNKSKISAGSVVKVSPQSIDTDDSPKFITKTK